MNLVGSTYRKNSIHFGKYAKEQYGNRKKCSMCWLTIDEGEYFITCQSNSYRSKDFYMHSSCIKSAQDKLESSKEELESAWSKQHAKTKAARADHKKKLKMAQEERVFKKSILKESLKKAEIKITALSIRNPDDYGIDGVGDSIAIYPKGGYDPLVMFKIEGQDVLIINPRCVPSRESEAFYYYREPFTIRSFYYFDRERSSFSYTKISLADANSIDLIAQAIKDYAHGDLTPYMRKKRK